MARNILPTVRDWTSDAGRGILRGISLVHKYGRNGAVGSSMEDVWEVGGIKQFPTSAAVCAVSYSGNDYSGGTGAESITIVGLGSDWKEQEETLVLTNGASPKNTTNTWTRVFRAYVNTNGTYQQTYGPGAGTNQNAITGTIGGNTQFSILAGEGQTLDTHYTVPVGKEATFYDISGNVEASKPCDVYMWQRRDADNTSTPGGRRIVHISEGVTGSFIHTTTDAQVFPAKTDLWVTAQYTTGGGSTAIVTADYTLKVYDVS